MSIPRAPVVGLRSCFVAVVLGAIVPAAGARAGAAADDLAGRVVDRAGGAVSGLPIWAIGGEWEHPRVVARTTSGREGRFVLPPPSGPRGPQDMLNLTILARA